MSTRVLTTKKVKVSSKGQLIFTIPKDYLKEIDVKTGDELVVEFLSDKIQIHNQRQQFKKKIKNFKPVTIGGNKKVDFSSTHNDIYD
jgi:bifunctional DNA-binding transcriptional regulator/antitoxin component of YhaV-PrlF toxin-antitoxin module